MKILFTGGGTGGHILPIIAVEREIRRLYPKKDLRLYYVGPRDDFNSILLSQEDIKIRTVFAGKIRRYFGFTSFFQNLWDILFKMPLGILQAFFIIFFSAPDIIFSKGGYGAVPATLAGWILRVPILLHESDIVPGTANRFLSRFAKEIFVSFSVKAVENLPPDKMILVGTPIRREILRGDASLAKEYFRLSGEKPVVFIMGGSQGAQRINEMILEILPSLLSEFEVIHQCGEKNFKQTQTEAGIMIQKGNEKYYHLFPFLKEEELKQAYAAAQIIVSRAGASSVFEIAALGKPSILIPLPESAQNHQFRNAYYYADSGACLVIEESNLSPHYFLERLKFISSRPDEMKKMEIAATAFSKPLAAKIIAEYLLGYLL
jgi:UDP-N-acetylglucosamine--N-acetylmuramyl-(pentapeptide) pyrophosphoryl-undecaprenol N-acetylglucosamine transferase